MLEPMQPSMDPPTTAALGGGVARGDRGSPADVSFESDELIIHSQKVAILQKNLERIEEIFHVVVGLGLSAQEDVEMQWISIQGLPEDRTMAKSYIKALCSPGNVLSINFSNDLYATLSQPELHARLEKQSNTAILFPSIGQAVIQGEDDLAVTLAVSAIEDIIQKFNDVNIPDMSSPTSTGEVSDRLDRELRRLSSQNKELYDQEFDVESLKSLPGPVKRTLLKQYMDDSRQNSVEEPKASDSGYAQDPDQTVPMTLVGVESATSISSSERRFVDLHPQKRAVAAKDGASSWSAIDLHPSQNSSLSLSLHLSDTREAHKVGVVDLTESPVCSPPVQQRISPLGASENQNTTARSDPPSPPIGNGGIVTEAITFALNSGYTKEEIDEVRKIYGEYLSTGQFLQALHTNRKERTQKHAVTVAELEAVHVPRPPPDRHQSNEDTDDEERAVTPTGKQQVHQTHNQGPKTKKGKISKTTPAKKQGKRTSRWKHRSPTEENTEKMEVVSLSDDEDDEPAANKGAAQSKPMYDILKNSPLPGDYLERLTRDYADEDSSDIEELRKNNTVRRALLEQALVLDKRRGQPDEEEDEDDMQEISEEEWVTAEKDGRQRFPKSPNTKAMEVVDDRGPKPAEAGENTKRPKKQSDKKRPVAAAAAAAVDSVEPPKGRFQPGPPDGLIGNLDTLDDFSMPYEIQDQSDGAAGRNQQRGPNWAPYFKPNQQQRNNQPYNHPPVQQYKQQQQHYQPQSHHPAPNHHPQQQQQQPHPQQYQPPPLMASAANKLNSNLRYIVIDGSNVAMTHGNHQVFSCKGIKICIDYFRRRGHREVTAFVPQWRTHAPRPDYPIRDQHMLEELRKEGTLVFTPARRVPGKNIVCYDDKFVLRLAQETDGIVVSNDNYRDLWAEKREWRQIIEDRLLMFSFVGDIFMAPEDPLGRTGPILDAFLRKNNDLCADQYNQEQQERPRGGDMGGRQYNNRPNHQGQGARPIVGMHQLPYQGRPLQGQVNTGQFQGRPLVRNPAGYQGQGQGYQGQGNPGQGHFVHNNQGQNHFNQNPQHRPRQRQNSQTEALKKDLNGIFPDKEQRIVEVLRQHPHETDITRLADFMLED